MSKSVFLLSFLLLAYPAMSSDGSDGLRKCFHESVLDESKIDMFHQKVMAIDMPSAIEKAYQAASFALLAKKVWNPIEKIEYLNRYSKLIDRAIAAAPNNIEIRFLRLSIDHNTPMIAGRRHHVDDDKKQILKLLAPLVKFELDTYFNRFIIYFLKSEKIYSESELQFVIARLT